MEQNLDLHRRWMADVRALSHVPASQTDTDAVYFDLLARHAEPHRRYHGVSHLENLFRLLDRFAGDLAPGSAPRLAVWWHDAIYDPTARDNETRSAELAIRDLAHLSADGERALNLSGLILRTANHWDGPSLGDGDLFLDADIAILGAETDIYDGYVANVRQEYAFAPDDAWRAGRGAFLTSALTRPRLFRTDVFNDAFGAQARANMERELKSLSP